MKVVSLWSGGKDSTLACYKAIKEGHDIIRLVNFLDETTGRSLSHGISKEIINIQIQSTEMPYTQNEMPRSEYRRRFISIMLQFKKIDGAEGIVFGDIYLEAHKEWIEDVCGELGLEAVMPLWGIDTKNLAGEFVDLKFESLIAATDNRFMGPEFLGRKFDHDLIDKLIKMRIDPCGEQGEFHTFVYSGPIFKKPFNFKMSEKRFEHGHWFLNLD